MTDNTWPDPARPGVPANPERDGWHWLWRNRCGGIDPWYWDVSLGGDGLGGWAEKSGDGAPSDFERAFTYIAPALTPDQVAAAVQAEREACATWHDDMARSRRHAGFEDVAILHDLWAEQIRSRGPSDALAQAEKRGMERAADILRREAGHWTEWSAGELAANAEAAIRAAAGKGAGE